jgi:predicted dithiol-disulfide oxidoreductase (DUF899 family)
MTDESTNLGEPAASATNAPSLPPAVDWAAFEAALDRPRIREKARTRDGGPVAAARRRLPMVEVDASTALIGPDGPLTLLEAFEGRRQLIACYFVWNPGRTAPERCEGCTWNNSQVAELAYLHSRDTTYAVLCRDPPDEVLRHHDLLGSDMPWYSARVSLDTLLVGRHIGMTHLVCYLRDGDRVFQTWSRPEA